MKNLNNKGLKNYNSAEIQKVILEMQESRNKCFIAKDKQGGGAWQKDGIESAALNLKRKIDTALRQYKNGDLFDIKEGTSTLDTLNDLINMAEMYQALLYLTAVQNSDDATAVRFHETFK